MSAPTPAAGFPEGFPSLGEPFEGLGRHWAAMQTLPHEAIRYFQTRFGIRGRYEYDPSFDQQGLTSWPELVSKIGWPSLASWDALLLNLWHEEGHQVQPMWAALPVLEAYWERDAWDHALRRARQSGVPQVYLRHWQIVRDQWHRQEPSFLLEQLVQRVARLARRLDPFR